MTTKVTMEVNISILSTEELVRLRKELKKELFTYSTDEPEFTKIENQIEILKDELNKRYLQAFPGIKVKKISNYEEVIDDESIIDEKEKKNELKIFREELSTKSKEEINKAFEEFKEDKLDISILPEQYIDFTTVEMNKVKSLNVDKIKSLEDVKRVLKFLNITATDNSVVTTSGFEEVRDLFE